MAGFLYLLPASRDELLEPTSEDRRRLRGLDRWGLDRVLGDLESSPRDATLAAVNPSTIVPGLGEWSAGTGTVLYPAPVDGVGAAQVGLYPNRQRWFEATAPDGSRFGIGVVVGAEPTPQELRRRELIAGPQIADVSGVAWQIPVARSPGNPFGHLPTVYRWGADWSSQVAGVEARHQALWELSGQVWDKFNHDEWSERQSDGYEARRPSDLPEPEELCRDELTDAWLTTVALRALSANYRVGPAEINAFHSLGRPVIGAKQVMHFALALIDYEIVAMLAKKKRSGIDPDTRGSSSSTPGGEDCCQDIAPAAVS